MCVAWAWPAHLFDRLLASEEEDMHTWIRVCVCASVHTWMRICLLMLVCLSAFARIDAAPHLVATLELTPHLVKREAK